MLTYTPPPRSRRKAAGFLIKKILPGLLLLLLPTLSPAQHRAQVALLTERADSAIEAGELSLAEKLTLEAIQLVRSGKDDALEAKILVNLISIKIEQDNSINIDEWYDRALKLTSGTGDSMELANLWSIRARYLMYNQEYTEAQNYYNLAGKVYRKLGNDPVAGYYYNDLGYLAEATGDHQAAASSYLKAIPIFELAGEAAWPILSAISPIPILTWMSRRKRLSTPGDRLVYEKKPVIKKASPSCWAILPGST